MILAFSFILILFVYFYKNYLHKYGEKLLLFPFLLALPIYFLDSVYPAISYKNFNYLLSIKNINTEGMFLLTLSFWMSSFLLYKNQLKSLFLFTLIPLALLFEIEKAHISLLVILLIEQTTSGRKDTHSSRIILPVISLLFYVTSNTFLNLIPDELVITAVLILISCYFFLILRNAEERIDLNVLQIVLSGFVLKDLFFQIEGAEVDGLFIVIFGLAASVGAIFSFSKIRTSVLSILFGASFLYLMQEVDKNFIALQLYLMILVYYKLNSFKKPSPELLKLKIVGFYVNFIALAFLLFQVMKYISSTSSIVLLSVLIALFTFRKDIINYCGLLITESKKELVVKALIILNIFLVWSIHA